MTPFFCAQVQLIQTFPVLLLFPVSHSCAPARLIRDFMLDYVRTHRSDLACPPSASVRRRGEYAYFVFLASPLFLFLVRRRANTQLVSDYVTTHDNDITRRLSFLVRRRSDCAHFVFLDSRRHPWLLQSCPHGPYWGPLGVLTASLDDPSRSSGSFPGHRVL